MDKKLNTIIASIILTTLGLGTILAIVFLISGRSEFMILTLAVYAVSFATLALESCLEISSIVRTRQGEKLKAQEINAGVEINQEDQNNEPASALAPSLWTRIVKLVIFALLTIFALVLLILY